MNSIYQAPLSELSNILILFGIALIIIGIIIAFILMLIFVFKSNKKADIKGGGVILIGPIPIIIGTDKQSVKIVIILALVLMILAFILFFVIPWWLI